MSDTPTAPASVRSVTQRIRTGSTEWRAIVGDLWDHYRRDLSDAGRQDQTLYRDATDRIQRVVPTVRRVALELGSPPYNPLPVVSWRYRSTGLVVEPGTPDHDALVAERIAIGTDEAMRTASEMMPILGSATIWTEPTRVGRGRPGSARVRALPPHRQYVERYDYGSTDERDVEVWWREVPYRADDLPFGMASAWLLEPRWLRVTVDGATWHARPHQSSKAREVGPAWTGIGEIPVTVLRAGPVDESEFWPQAPLDLLLAARAINHDLTDHGDVARLQGHGTGWIRASSSKKVNLGLRDFVEVPMDDAGGPPIGYATPNADLGGMRDASSHYISSVIAHQGLNPATYMRSAGVTALAKAIELADRAIEQRRHEPELRRAEQRIQDQARAWAKQLRGADLPDVLVDVDYQARALPQEPQAQAQALAALVSAKIIGVDRARAILDGVSLDEARDRRRAEEIAPTLAPVAADVAPETGGVAEVATGPAAPPEPDEAAGVSEVADVALNGAQITSVLEIVSQVGAGTMSADGGKALLVGGLGLSEETATRILAGARAPVVAATPTAPPAAEA